MTSLLLALILAGPSAFAADFEAITPIKLKFDWAPYPVAQVDLPAEFVADLRSMGIQSLGEALLGTEVEMLERPHGAEALVRLTEFLGRRRIEWTTSDFIGLPWRLRVQLYKLGLRRKADLFREPERIREMLEDLGDLDPRFRDFFEKTLPFWQCEHEFESRK